MTKRILLFVFFTLLVFAQVGWCSSGGGVETFLMAFEQFGTESTNRWMLLAAIAAATLISEDLACITAGLLAARAIISPFEAVAASGLGIYIGDILLYLTGYLIGVRALHHAPLKWFVSEKTVRQCRTLFEKRGLGLIFMSRFLPGTRTATFIAAGLVQVGAIRLMIVFACAVLVWTPLLVLGAMLVGRQVVDYVEIYSSWALWVFLLLLGLLFLVNHLILPLFTWRGRRLLLSRWRRLSGWEFWPYYITNIVTFIYVAYTGVFKYRNLTLFTVTNPAIKPDSGFIGESKSEIFQGLPADAMGRWQLVAATVEPEHRYPLLAEFMIQHGLDFPIVLKPDRGQRGQGVGICQNEDDAQTWLNQAETDYIMMEFLPGEEFGLFYYRFPQASKGEIFSINRKKLLYVSGDGIRTLEELILADERALCMAPTFFKALESELLDIVPAGVIKQLVQVGTHSRGAMFLDGIDLASPELLDEIEKIAKPYQGFYFGRFDLKAPDEMDFTQGKNLKVIELNGITSEATHIYDPKNSLMYAWKTLIEQWSLAFQIADENHQRGCKPIPLRAFIEHWYRAGRS